MKIIKHRGRIAPLAIVVAACILPSSIATAGIGSVEVSFELEIDEAGEVSWIDVGDIFSSTFILAPGFDNAANQDIYVSSSSFGDVTHFMNGFDPAISAAGNLIVSTSAGLDNFTLNFQAFSDGFDGGAPVHIAIAFNSQDVFDKGVNGNLDFEDIIAGFSNFDLSDGEVEIFGGVGQSVTGRFNTFTIPTPGTMGLLCFGGLIGTRRRRVG